VADTNVGTVLGEIFGIRKSKSANMRKGVTFDKCRFVHRVICSNRKTCSGFELVVGRRAEGHGIVSR
jgi:hypothetical protein